MAEKDSIRLQKYLAEAGVASRRSAEKLIAEGRIRVDGQVVTELGTRVLRSSKVEVDGRSVSCQIPRQYLALNKPRGYVCSTVGSDKFPSFLDLVPQKVMSGLHHVGRLDVASEGLLFVTNDGSFTELVTHPRYEVRKSYEVTALGKAPSDFAERCVAGVQMGEDRLRFVGVEVTWSDGDRTVYAVELIGGKNREIRRMFEYFGLRVQRLVRVRIGSIALDGLKTGRWRDLSASEIDEFLRLRSSTG